MAKRSSRARQSSGRNRNLPVVVLDGPAVANGDGVDSDVGRLQDSSSDSASAVCGAVLQSQQSEDPIDAAEVVAALSDVDSGGPEVVVDGTSKEIAAGEAKKLKSPVVPSSVRRRSKFFFITRNR